VTPTVFVLGGFQTDFARNVTREGGSLLRLMRETVHGALAAVDVAPSEIEVAHVGNFAAELYAGQGHLGGLLVEAEPALAGVPTSRHEAACASGSMALLAAMADLEAGRYDVALVLGVELMRTRPAVEAQRLLGAAAWVPRQTEGVEFPWPSLFSQLVDAYERRWGLRDEHLWALGRANFEHARRNPNAQTRGWQFAPEAFGADDTLNPVVAGRIRKHECSQISDGGAALVLAGPRFAAAWAARRGQPLDGVARIRGWGHRTGRMRFDDALAGGGSGSEHLLPHVRRAIVDALGRAGLPGPQALDVIECHDCFTITEYMAIDHFGLTPPGQSWRFIEEGTFAFGGRLPINPSGGLIGGGHPVGASGVRMLLDAAKQVTGSAGGYQVDGACTAATLNIGGSATTSACFVVGAGAGA
jgi:acetyl-CoA C-acetyltransferase